MSIQLSDRLLEQCLYYVKANIHENGWEKGTIHFRICELLCEHVTGKEYGKMSHSGLKLKIHKLTSEITDSLDKIGIPVPIGYVRPTIFEEDMPRYASKLAYNLVLKIDQQDKNELLKLVRSD